MAAGVILSQRIVSLAPPPATPDLAFTNFSGGSPGADFFTDGNGGTTASYPSDPTGSGRGTVGAIRYQGSGSIIDENRAFYVGDPSVIPAHFWFKYEFYFPAGIARYTNTNLQRKLVYFRDQNQSFRALVIYQWGTSLGYVIQTQENNNNNDDDIGTVTAGIWHTLKGEMQFNSSTSASDGYFKLWFDGTLVSQKLNTKLYSGGTRGYNEFMGFGYQREGGTSKDPTDTSCDESRYLDNIGLSTFDPG